MKDRPGHDVRYALNSNKIKNKLGWSPRTNFEQGIKLTFDWYNKNKAPNEVSNLTKNFGMFQIGPSVSTNAQMVTDTVFGGVYDRRVWAINGGLMYNQISTKFLGIGFSTKVKGVIYLYQEVPEEQRNVLDDVDLQAEIGFTFFSVLNIYYGRTFVLNDSIIDSNPDTTFIGGRQTRDHIGISLVLNPSLLKFGLQGM